MRSKHPYIQIYLRKNIKLRRKLKDNILVLQRVELGRQSRDLTSYQKEDKGQAVRTSEGKAYQGRRELGA